MKIQLNDQRTLAYEEYGDSHGKPLFFSTECRGRACFGHTTKSQKNQA
jgi:hypothetical protein